MQNIAVCLLQCRVILHLSVWHRWAALQCTICDAFWHWNALHYFDGRCLAYIMSALDFENLCIAKIQIVHEHWVLSINRRKIYQMFWGLHFNNKYCFIHHSLLSFCKWRTPQTLSESSAASSLCAIIVLVHDNYAHIQKYFSKRILPEL